MDNEWIQIILADKTKGNCRFLSVQKETLKRLTHVRGNIYKDDPRLRVANDLPTPEPGIPEHIQRQAEKSWQLHLAGTRQASPVQTVKAEVKPMTLEEEVRHTWRFNPGIRKEFTSQASYAAYMKAQKAGRIKVCGKV